MASDAPCKLGLFLPAALHDRMVDANRDKPRGALQAAYAAAFVALLDALDDGDRGGVRRRARPQTARHHPLERGAL